MPYTKHEFGDAVGFKIEKDGEVEFITLFPSDSIDGGEPAVFVYQGATGNPDYDEPQHFYAPFGSNGDSDATALNRIAALLHGRKDPTPLVIELVAEYVRATGRTIEQG